MVRYLWGLAYDSLNTVNIQASKLSTQALSIIETHQQTNSLFTLEEREVIYNDQAVRLTLEDVEKGNYLRQKPICDTHGHIVGYIVEGVVHENHIKILAAVTDADAVQKVDSGEYTGFSIGYSFDNERGQVSNKQIREVSICKNPFFDACRIHVAASKDSPSPVVTVDPKTQFTILPDVISPLIENMTKIDEKKEENPKYKDNIFDIILSLASLKTRLPMSTPNSAPPVTLTPIPAQQSAAAQPPAQPPVQQPPAEKPAAPAPLPPASQTQDLRPLAERLEEQQRLIKQYEEEFSAIQKPRVDTTLNIFAKVCIFNFFTFTFLFFYNTLSSFFSLSFVIILLYRPFFPYHL